MLIDSHCHIHDIEFFPDNRLEVYQRARAAEVAMVCVGTSQADSRTAVEFVADKEGTWATVGVHPHDSKEGVAEIGQLLAAQAPDQATRQRSKIIGIGEIGLDYYYNNSPRQVQIEALEQQLQWASDYQLPVNFHVRAAYEDFWPILDNFPGIRGVLHCFTAEQADLQAGLQRDLFIGVNGISTFTKDPAQQAMFRSIPLQKLLLETDAPFLTPVPLRGTINEPAFVRHVAEHQASTTGVSLEDLIAQTTANATGLFKIA